MSQDGRTSNSWARWYWIVVVSKPWSITSRLSRTWHLDECLFKKTEGTSCLSRSMYSRCSWPTLKGHNKSIYANVTERRGGGEGPAGSKHHFRGCSSRSSHCTDIARYITAIRRQNCTSSTKIMRRMTSTSARRNNKQNRSSSIKLHVILLSFSRRRRSNQSPSMSRRIAEFGRSQMGVTINWSDPNFSLHMFTGEFEKAWWT